MTDDRYDDRSEARYEETGTNPKGAHSESSRTRAMDRARSRSPHPALRYSVVVVLGAVTSMGERNSSDEVLAEDIPKRLAEETHDAWTGEPRNAATTDEHYALWAARAEEEIEKALVAIQDPSETMDAVFSSLGLAELAYHIAVGDTKPDEWPEDYEPECICPPELVAGGGFKGDCPARGYAHG